VAPRAYDPPRLPFDQNRWTVTSAAIRFHVYPVPFMISFLQWISRTESVQAALSGPVGPGCEPVASAFRGMARSWAQQEEFLPSRRCERPKITTQWRRARATISRISGTTSGPREPPLQPFLVRFNRSRARKTLQLRLACGLSRR
jgi:hypothetical protein